MVDGKASHKHAGMMEQADMPDGSIPLTLTIHTHYGIIFSSGREGSRSSAHIREGPHVPIAEIRRFLESFKKGE